MTAHFFLYLLQNPDTWFLLLELEIISRGWSMFSYINGLPHA